jgi:hypothetical protein
MSCHALDVSMADLLYLVVYLMQILSITYIEVEEVRAAVMHKRNHRFDREPIEEIALLCCPSYVYICTQ